MTNEQIAAFTIILGGTVIALTFYAFSIFSRFLDREKRRGELFRAEHAAKKSEPKDPQ